MYLQNHTYYSFRYGTIPTRELLRMANSYGITEMAVTDINTTAACLDFVRLSGQYHIRPVLGIDFRDGARPLYVALARNNEGFKLLNDYLSSCLHQKLSPPDEAPPLPDCFIIYPFSNIPRRRLRSHEYIGISREDLTRFPFSPHARRAGKVVILQPASFRNKQDFNAHRLLRAIDNNTLLSKLSTDETGNPEHRLYPPEELREVFRDYPGVISNTEHLLAECSIEFDFGEHRNHKSI